MKRENLCEVTCCLQKKKARRRIRQLCKADISSARVKDQPWSENEANRRNVMSPEKLWQDLSQSRQRSYFKYKCIMSDKTYASDCQREDKE